MADDIALPATGGVVATDERNIAGVDKHVQRVVDQGATAIAGGSASCTTTSGEKIAARETRKAVHMSSPTSNTQDITIGPSGVAAGVGTVLPPGGSFTSETTAAIHAVAASGTQTLKYTEEYDA